jgi:unsaturated chondroitin disaccharide hydrolase
MRKIKVLLTLAVLSLPFTAASAKGFDVSRQLRYCHLQVLRTLSDMGATAGKADYCLMPRNVLRGDTAWNLRRVSAEEWCGGFWPGILWYDYEATADTVVLRQAQCYTEPLAFLSRRPIFDHDIGFLVFCSFGNGCRLTGNAVYRRVILDAADSLATLFNPRVGTLLSWPREVKPRHWPHNTIMDNMMNLEMLFWAAKNGGSHRLYDIAVSHARRTMQCQFRPDYTCYHVAVYDTLTGRFIKGVTHQGYSDQSTWMRGQSWAVYGFTMVYRETRDITFLRFAQHVADAFIARLPHDYVPYWDNDDPAGKAAPRDASAGCVAASALLELSTYLPHEKGEYYFGIAEHILTSLSTARYQARKASPAFLLHSTGHWPAHSEVDASIIYADYYYLEALLRYRALSRK